MEEFDCLAGRRGLSADLELPYLFEVQHIFICQDVGSWVRARGLLCFVLGSESRNEEGNSDVCVGGWCVASYSECIEECEPTFRVNIYSILLSVIMYVIFLYLTEKARFIKSGIGHTQR